jgi:hypothetical protein
MKNTDQTQHTPTPWRHERQYSYINIFDANGLFVASTGAYYTDKEDSLDNAAHIVKCVNMHDELIIELSEFLECLEKGISCNIQVGSFKHEKLRSLLNKTNQL